MRRPPFDRTLREAFALALVAWAMAVLFGIRGACRPESEFRSRTPRARIYLNAARTRELRLLEGIGERTAASILEQREARAGFESPFEILSARGIGEATFRRIRGDFVVETEERR